jgi:hypothetical protein
MANGDGKYNALSIEESVSFTLKPAEQVRVRFLAPPCGVLNHSPHTLTVEIYMKRSIFLKKFVWLG